MRLLALGCVVALLLSGCMAPFQPDYPSVAFNTRWDLGGLQQVSADHRFLLLQREQHIGWDLGGSFEGPFRVEFCPDARFPDECAFRHEHIFPPRTSSSLQGPEMFVGPFIAGEAILRVSCACDAAYTVHVYLVPS